MDRISAIRNVEDALRAFENGEADLTDTEQRVAAVLRTYATEFDGDDDVFRAVGEDPVDGRVVVAPSAPAARERVLALSGFDPQARSAAGDGDDGNDDDLSSGESNVTEGANDGDDSNPRNMSDNLTAKESDTVPEFEVERI